MKLGSIMLVIAAAAWPGQARADEVRRLPVKEYRDKMKAGWLGQMAGVSWGAGTSRKSTIMSARSARPSRRV